jgi:hypothetical protein
VIHFPGCRPFHADPRMVEDCHPGLNLDRNGIELGYLPRSH